MSDVLYAFRTLRKTPGFTSVAVLAIALGIGANSAMFTMVNAVLLRPLPYPAADRLVVIWEQAPHKERMSVAYPNFMDWRRMARSFERIEAYRSTQLTVTGIDRADRVRGRSVTAGFFNLLGVNPVLGRSFSPEDDVLTAKPVAVVSYEFWKNRLGGGVDAIGRMLTVNGKPTQVIGVLPASFEFGVWKAELFTPHGPLGLNKNDADRGNHGGTVGIARLKPGISLEQADAEMKTIAAQLEKQYPASNSGNSAMVKSAYEQLVADTRTPLLVLLAAVGFVLLIACSNVASLMLARSNSRRSEIAIRTALGARRWDIARQLLSEGTLIAAMGGVLGLLLSMWGVEALLKIAPQDVPRAATARIDEWVVLFTAAVSILTGLLFSLAPAIQASRADLNSALKTTARSSGAALDRHRLRKLLLAGEIALTLALSVGAALMIRSFERVRSINPGFRSDHLLTFHIAPTPPKYKADADYRAYFNRVAESVRAVPGVRSASLIGCLPIEGTCWGSIFTIEGRPVPRRADLPEAQWNVASAGYFETMGIKLLRGRTFDATDRADSRPVAIMNESAARKFFPDQDPIGQRVKQGWPEQTTPFREIVGVVADVKQNGPDQAQLSEIFLPSTQELDRGPFIVLRTEVPPTGLVSQVRNAVAGIDPDVPVYSISAMEDLLSTSVSTRRFSMLLVTLFAGVAVFLAAIGVHGVVASSVTQRTQEIGLRMALGAKPRQVLGMVIGEGMLMALAGITAGILGALVLTRLMKSLLFGINNTDPVSFVLVAALLAAVTFVASYLPARRALRVDPIVALRVD